MNKIYDERLNFLEEKLNGINIVEGKWYRRNNIVYTIICYINNIIALRLSENHEFIPVFIKRARKFILSKGVNSLSEEYICYASEYLELVEKQLINNKGCKGN